MNSRSRVSPATTGATLGRTTSPIAADPLTQSAAGERAVAAAGRPVHEATAGPTAAMFESLRLVTGHAVAAVTEQVRARCGIGLEELELLYRLQTGDQSRLKTGALGSIVTPDKSKITRLVDRLTTAGYLRRDGDPADRRITYVAITASGSALLDQAGPAWAAGVRATVGPRHLPRNELDHVLPILDDLVLGNGWGLATRFGRDIQPDWVGAARPTLHRLMTADGVTGPDRLDDRYGALWIALLRVTAVVEQALDAVLAAQHQLSLNEYRLLDALRHAPDRRLTMSELADAVGITRSGVTRLVDRLGAGPTATTGAGPAEDADPVAYLTRRPHPTNRRVVFAELLPPGLDLARAAQTTTTNVLDEHITRHLDRAALTTLTATLARLARGVSTNP